MIFCKDCLFWIDDESDTNYIMHPFDEDTFKEKKMPFLVKRCNCSNITLFERNPNIDGVSLCDGSNYRAAMYTGENFGCVNGKEKEKDRGIGMEYNGKEYELIVVPENKEDPDNDCEGCAFNDPVSKDFVTDGCSHALELFESCLCDDGPTDRKIWKPKK